MRSPVRGGWTEARRAYLTVLLLNAADGTAGTLVSPFLASRGHPVAEIGFLVAGYAVASLLSRLPAGRAADGRAPKRWFLAAALGMAVTLVLYPLLAGQPAFWLVRLGHGLAAGTATTLNFAAFLGGVAGQNRVRATSMYTASMSAGYTLGNFSSGLLADLFGYDLVFRLVALCPLLATLGAPSATPAQQPGRDAARPREPLLATLRRPEVRAVPLLAFTVHFIHQTLGTLFPLYALSIGQSLSLVGTARGLQSLANTLVRPFGEPLFRLLGLTGLAIVGVTADVLAVVSIPMISVPLILVATFVLVGAARALAVVANALSTAELSERAVVKRGTASTLVSMGQDLGAVLAPAISGLTASAIGLGPALQVLPIAAGILGLAAVLQARWALRRAASESPSD